MFGLMQDRPLMISDLIEFAAMNHGDEEIVSRTVEGPIHRYTYKACASRSRQLAKALIKLGVKQGDTLGTMAWNGYRHVEIYYAVSGMGAVCHTINPRLFPEQVIYIANHAEDTYIFTDLTFVPLFDKLAEQLPNVKGYIVMTDEAHMPETSLPNLICYETLMDSADDDYAWPLFDERTASSLCYTSGTTGNPKGVCQQHRNLLHSTRVYTNLARLDSNDRLSLLHSTNVIAGSTALFGALLNGATILPYRLQRQRLDGLAEWLEQRKITCFHTVPTVMRHLAHATRASQHKFTDRDRRQEKQAGSETGGCRDHRRIICDQSFALNGICGEREHGAKDEQVPQECVSAFSCWLHAADQCDAGQCHGDANQPAPGDSFSQDEK